MEHFPYQDGLLVNYWDTSFSDNNESEHPGQGLVLPIDSHPQPIYHLDGQPWRGRIQTYDAPFSLEKARLVHAAHRTGGPSYIRGQDAQPMFDDSRSYWNPAQPTVGVKVPARRRADPGGQRRRHVDAGPHRLDEAGRIAADGIGASYSVRAP